MTITNVFQLFHCDLYSFKFSHDFKAVFDCHILSLCHEFAFTFSAFTVMNKLIHNKEVKVVGEFGLTIYLHDSGKISCSRFRDINQFGDSHGACCFLSTHFCVLPLYFIGHPLLSTERVSKSSLVSQLQRRKKIDRPYSDIINKVTVDCWYFRFGCHSEMTLYLYKSYYNLNAPEKTNRSLILSRLSLIVRVNVVLNGTVVVDSD